MASNDSILSAEQIKTFCQDGVLVVEDFLTKDEIKLHQNEFKTSLSSHHKVNPDDMASTGHHLANLSSTNGSGGVLDIFYEKWKIKLAVNPKLFAMTCELWKNSYFHEGEEQPGQDNDTYYMWHPHGPFDYQRGYMYIDRVGYRIPTKLAQQLGSSKKRPLQRSLTPHLDCCPDQLWAGTNKWRPIQCFVSLEDAMLPNHGGFEASPGFHKEFHQWAVHRQGTDDAEATPPSLCRGEYTHIRPHEDNSVMQRIQHVPVPAGSVVFWDHRIPHANSYRHEGTNPRTVVYCSFLPDVALNREYVQSQLDLWRSGTNPTDQWIRDTAANTAPLCSPEEVLTTSLERRLGGLEPW